MAQCDSGVLQWDMLFTKTIFNTIYNNIHQNYIISLELHEVFMISYYLRD